MDRIEAMRAFVVVVNEGQFTRAAERLERSPQLVSKQVAELERHLGVRLLDRTTRRTRLTEAGEQYHQRARQILDDINDMESEAGDLQSAARGRLRISAPVSFAIHHMPSLLTDFQQAHPAVSIDLQLNDRKVDIIEEGFDVAIRIGHLKSSSLIARRIAPVRLVLCASPDYLEENGVPTAPEELRRHRYLRYSYMEEAASELHQWLRTDERSEPGDLVSNNGDVLVKAALAGAGIALQPTFLVGDAIRAGLLQVVLPKHEPEPMALYAVYAHRQLLASKVRGFVEFMSSYFGDPPGWDQKL